MRIEPITKQQTAMLKGVAILYIVLHNFFHWIAPSTGGENEFVFGSHRIWDFFSAIVTYPFDIINILFSYLGHYGVQVFVLISGYGLAMSMMKKKQSWLKFVTDKLVKLFPLLLVGIVVFVFFTIFNKQKFPDSSFWSNIKYNLLFVNTLFPEKAYNVTGPWWFFGLIFQLYLLFPLLFKALQRYGWKAFAIICALCYTWIYADLYIKGFSSPFVHLLQNAPGHIPEFILGIMLALNSGKEFAGSELSNKNKNAVILITAGIVFILGNFYEIFFPLTFLAIAYIAVRQCYYLSPKLEKSSFWSKNLTFVGNISMIMFVVNGMIREPFISLVNANNTTLMRYFAAFLFLMALIAISVAVKYLYDRLVSLFKFLVRKISSIAIVRKSGKYVSVLAQAFFIIVAVFFVVRYTTILTKPMQEFGADVIIQSDSELFTLENNVEYKSLTKNITFEHDYQSINVNVEFDIVDYQGEMPLLVCQIDGGKLWHGKKIELKEKAPSHYTFSTDLVPSGFAKGDVFKIYLWNNKKCFMKYDNVNVKINGSKSFVD